MGGRSANTIGWSGGASSTPLTPSELNDVYTHGQFWVPAGALTPDTTASPPVFEKYEFSNQANNYYTQTVLNFATSENMEACFNWAFKADFVAVPSASLKLKVKPVYFVPVTVAAPNNVVRVAMSVDNAIVGGNLDQNGNPVQVDWNITNLNAELLNSGVGADGEDSIALTVGGDTLNSSGLNFLQILFEREGNDAADTYTNTLHLLGIMVQFAVDFNNVAEWPV